MNTLRNKVQLIGNLGNNPEVKSLEGGRKLAKFSLATSEQYKTKDGEKVKETQWYNLVTFGKTANIVEKYLKKGSRVAVEGKLTSRDYTDKDGIKRSFVEVQVNELLMLGHLSKA
ncbi:MAG TPA: single-stranded DNA-binding protein [Bacteroidia bacterium]